jgi:hypothetical protein
MRDKSRGYWVSNITFYTLAVFAMAAQWAARGTVGRLHWLDDGNMVVVLVCGHHSIQAEAALTAFYSYWILFYLECVPRCVSCAYSKPISNAYFNSLHRSRPRHVACSLRLDHNNTSGTNRPATSRLRRLTNHRSTSGLVKSPTSRPSVSSRFPSYSSTCRSSPRSAFAASSGASSPSAWPRHSPSPLPPSSSARPSASHGNSGMASTRASASTTIR